MKRLVLTVSILVLIAAFQAAPSSAESVGSEPSTFPHGVGSNDVGTQAAGLWTKTTAPSLIVRWSPDPLFLIANERAVAVDPKRDGTVLFPIRGLVPGTRYYYKFEDPATGVESRTGTFETAPDPAADVNVTFAFSGDQDGTIDLNTGQPCFNNFETFNAVQQEDPDFYVNLGDTIYSDSGCRANPANTLEEYRATHRQNLSYETLRDLRAATGFYTQWDDHEVRNDWDRETIDRDLLTNGRKAFIEYGGMRFPSPDVGFYRHFQWGSEVEIFILDERSFRTTEADRMDADHDGTLDCQNPTSGQPDLAPSLSQDWRDVFGSALPGSGLDQPVPEQCKEDLRAKGRTMLGDAQRVRFLSDLASSTASFKLVMNEDPIQQIFALPYDRWEGYRWERNFILKAIDDSNIQNVLWLTTDVHAYLAHTVDYNTSEPGVGDQVENMIDYTMGPVATNTFDREIDAVAGAGASDLVREFLLNVNLNFCAQLGSYNSSDPAAPYYGYGFVFIDSTLDRIAIRPKDYTGTFIAGNGGTVPGARDDRCYDYIANER